MVAYGLSTRAKDPVDQIIDEVAASDVLPGKHTTRFPSDLLTFQLFDSYLLCIYEESFCCRAAKKAAEAKELAARRAALEKKTQARLAAEQARKVREAQEAEEEERAIKAQADAVVAPLGGLELVPSVASSEDPEDTVPLHREKKKK